MSFRCLNPFRKRASAFLTITTDSVELSERGRVIGCSPISVKEYAADEFQTKGPLVIFHALVWRDRFPYDYSVYLGNDCTIVICHEKFGQASYSGRIKSIALTGGGCLRRSEFNVWLECPVSEKPAPSNDADRKDIAVIQPKGPEKMTDPRVQSAMDSNIRFVSCQHAVPAESKDVAAAYPSAHLFSNGNAIFFDDKGQQLYGIQELGLCGLHQFVALYPDAPVYWASWVDKHRAVIVKEALPFLLRCIRTEPGKLPS